MGAGALRIRGGLRRPRTRSSRTTSGTCATAAWRWTSRSASRRCGSSWRSSSRAGVALRPASAHRDITPRREGGGADHLAPPRAGSCLLLTGEATTRSRRPRPAPHRRVRPQRRRPAIACRAVRSGCRRPRQLHAALASAAAQDDRAGRRRVQSRRPFLNPHGHDIYAARRGRAVLRAGLSLGGNAGRPGALVRGVVVDIDDARRTVDGAAIAVWGAGRDVRILDTTLRGNGVARAGISAQQPEGLEIRRVVVRRFTDFGIFVDANDLDRRPLSSPFRIRDADVAQIGRPDPDRRTAAPRPASGSATPARSAACASAIVRMDGPVDRDVRGTGAGRRARRRPRTHGRVHRALHARQHVPAAAHRPPGPGRPDGRVGGSRMGSAARRASTT